MVLAEISSPFLVQLDSEDRFSSIENPSIQGRVLVEHGQMIQGLLQEKTLTLSTSCSIDTVPTAGKKTRKVAQLSCILEITVYGPFELFDEIGSWFEEYEIYLQDPRDCHLNVK